MKFRKLGLSTALVCSALIFIGFVVFLLQGKLSRLGEGPAIEYPSGSAAASNAQGFLDGTFSLITNTRNLPGPVLRAFTEQRGSRLTMANPGKWFNASDLVIDAAPPSKRLIFAGVSGEKCFVHYEQGGIGLSHVLALFQLPSNDSMRPVWRGYCRGPAKSVEELRSSLRDGSCSSLDSVVYKGRRLSPR
jgi:hypothetical protein